MSDKIPELGALDKCIHDVPWNTCQACMTAAGLGPGKQTERRKSANASLRAVTHPIDETAQAGYVAPKA